MDPSEHELWFLSSLLHISLSFLLFRSVIVTPRVWKWSCLCCLTPIFTLDLEWARFESKWLVISGKGFLAITCLAAKVGDEICFPVGCSKPVILHKVGSDNMRGSKIGLLENLCTILLGAYEKSSGFRLGSRPVRQDLTLVEGNWFVAEFGFHLSSCPQGWVGSLTQEEVSCAPQLDRLKGASTWPLHLEILVEAERLRSSERSTYKFLARILRYGSDYSILSLHLQASKQCRKFFHIWSLNDWHKLSDLARQVAFIYGFFHEPASSDKLLFLANHHYENCVRTECM